MLTLAVITYNEIDRIGATLASVPFATERLVVDCGSTDGTVSLARRLGARVIETDWPGYSAQRNRALDAVTTPFVLFLDADERLSAPAMRAIPRALECPGIDAWSLRRSGRWGGRRLRHGLWYPDRQVRMLRVGRGRWAGVVHERLQVAGVVRALEHEILHDPYRDLREHLEAIDRYTQLQAEASAAEGIHARRRDPLLHGTWHAFRGLVLRSGWRDGPQGVAVAVLGAGATALKWKRIRTCASS